MGICNQDCFNCIYPDCIWDKDAMSWEDRKEAKEIEASHILFEDTEQSLRKKRTNQLYTQTHKTVIDIQNKAYREANRELLRKKGKIYRENNKEAIKLYRNFYNKAHKEEIALYRKSYKEARVAYDKAYYETHKAEKSTYWNGYYKTNQEKIKSQSKEYYKDNKEHENKHNKSENVTTCYIFAFIKRLKLPMNTFQIPCALLIDPKLSPNARIVGTAFYCFCDAEGVAKLTTCALQEIWSISPSSLTKSATALEHHGYLRRQRKQRYNAIAYHLAPITEECMTLPSDVFMDIQHTTPTASVLYLFLKTHNGGAFSINELGNALSVGRSSVCRSLQALQKANRIHIEHQGGYGGGAMVANRYSFPIRIY